MTNCHIGPVGREVAASIRTLREERRFTYVELVERLAGVGHAIPLVGVRRIERLERRVDVDDLLALAVVLGTSPTGLLPDVPTCSACHGSPPSGFCCRTCGARA